MREWAEEWAAWLHEHFVAVEFVTCAIAVIILAYGGLQYYSLAQEYAAAKAQFASTTSAYQRVTSSLRDKFSVVVSRNSVLSDSLTAEQTRNEKFQAEINGVKGTVDTLKKLSETDKELLQKYSKVYFLNENYVPSNLSVIDIKFLSNANAEQEFHSKALPFLTKMLEASDADGVHLRVASAYRSFGAQANLKSEYKTTFGSGANKFSADQGYSEHQLGTAVDFTTSEIGAIFSSNFSDSNGYNWLAQNAYKYGFVLSYPRGNTYYVYEPWHWRFVGVALATRLHYENKYFYDLDQREIDGYLPLMFN